MIPCNASQQIARCRYSTANDAVTLNSNAGPRHDRSTHDGAKSRGEIKDDPDALLFLRPTLLKETVDCIAIVCREFGLPPARPWELLIHVHLVKFQLLLSGIHPFFHVWLYFDKFAGLPIYAVDPPRAFGYFEFGVERSPSELRTKLFRIFVTEVSDFKTLRLSRTPRFGSLASTALPGELRFR